MIKNIKELDDHIARLTELKSTHQKGVIGTSDRTRELAGSVQQGFYIGQLALGLFRTLTNYHLPPKKRVKRVILALSSIVLINAVRKFMLQRRSKTS